MRVILITEDLQLDQYIVKPIVVEAFSQAKIKAEVCVLPEPRLRGVEAALSADTIDEIIADNAAMTDLFLLLIDRDCERASNTLRAQALEERHKGVLLACLAFEEVETWMLALHRAEVERLSGETWSKVRAHCDPKEAYALPLLAEQGSVGPGHGRKAAMRALKSQFRTLCSLCPELRELSDRIKTWSDRK